MAQTATTGPQAGTNLQDRSRFRDMVRSLKHRNFKLFFSGQMISLVGTWMDNIAEAWLVYRLTGSSLLLGTVAFAGQIPIFLLGPLGGFVADRMDRRSIIVVTQASSMILAGILSFLTLTKRVTVNEVITLASLMGVVNAFDVPARQSFLVEMVGREDLMNAIALNSSMFNSARVIGPSVAGILVASIGEGWCFFANSVSYIAVIAGLLMMRVPRSKIEKHSASPLEHIAEGFRYVKQTAPIRALLLLTGLNSIVALPYSVLMPIFAARILHGNARTLGVLMGATGIGALLGALVLASRTRLQGLAKIVAISCASFGVSLILFFVLPVLSALCLAFGSGRFLRHGADGCDQYLDSVHGSGSLAWSHHGCLLHDVPWNGSDRCPAGWNSCCSNRRAMDRRYWRNGVDPRGGNLRALFAQDTRAGSRADHRARFGRR